MLPFWELTPDQRQFRLDQAIALSEQARQVVVGIGMRKERTLHSVLKFYFEPDADRQEIPVEPFIADGQFCSAPGEARGLPASVSRHRRASGDPQKASVLE